MITLMTRSTPTEQSDLVLATDQAVYEMPSVLSYPHEVNGFDELLDAVGAHRSNYMQATYRKKIVAALNSGEWLMVVSDNQGCPLRSGHGKSATKRSRRLHPVAP